MIYCLIQKSAHVLIAVKLMLPGRNGTPVLAAEAGLTILAGVRVASAIVAAPVVQAALQKKI